MQSLKESLAIFLKIQEVEVQNVAAVVNRSQHTTQ